MATVNVVAIPAAVNYATLDDLNLRHSVQEVVEDYYDSRILKPEKEGEFMGITLLFLDEEVPNLIFKHLHLMLSKLSVSENDLLCQNRTR